MNELMTRLAEECRAEKIPAVDPEVGQLLALMVRTLGAERVLEIGTAIGYSALWICLGLPPRGRLVTIEQNKKRAARAQEVFAAAGVTDRVQLLVDDALAVLPELERGFDLVFLDATKTIYPELFSLAASLVRPGGWVITDNVLFKGMVLSPEPPPHYYRHMVEGLRQFWRTAEAKDDWIHGYLSLSDGVLMSRKGDGPDEEARTTGASRESRETGDGPCLRC